MVAVSGTWGPLGGRGRGMEATRQNWSARAIVRGRVRGRQCVVGDSGVGQDSKISVGAERVRIKDKRRRERGRGRGKRGTCAGSPAPHGVHCIGVQPLPHVHLGWKESGSSKSCLGRGAAQLGPSQPRSARTSCGGRAGWRGTRLGLRPLAAQNQPRKGAEMTSNERKGRGRRGSGLPTPPEHLTVADGALHCDPSFRV